jgi:hypothetical protein
MRELIDQILTLPDELTFSNEEVSPEIQSTIDLFDKTLSNLNEAAVNADLEAGNIYLWTDTMEALLPKDADFLKRLYDKLSALSAIDPGENDSMAYFTNRVNMLFTATSGALYDLVGPNKRTPEKTSADPDEIDSKVISAKKSIMKEKRWQFFPEEKITNDVIKSIGEPTSKHAIGLIEIAKKQIKQAQKVYKAVKEYNKLPDVSEYAERKKQVALEKVNKLDKACQTMLTDLQPHVINALVENDPKIVDAFVRSQKKAAVKSNFIFQDTLISFANKHAGSVSEDTALLIEKYNTVKFLKQIVEDNPKNKLSPTTRVAKFYDGLLNSEDLLDKDSLFRKFLNTVAKILDIPSLILKTDMPESAKNLTRKLAHTFFESGSKEGNFATDDEESPLLKRRRIDR